MKSLEVAKTQVGVTEKTGRNDGIMVEMYLASVSLGKYNPYCYAGPYWSFTVVTDDPCIPKTGLVLNVWNWAKRTGTRTPYEIEVGDFINWKYTGTRSHIERVTAIGRKGWVTTVAFNTSGTTKGNQRDGGGVHYKQRHLTHPLGMAVMRGAIGRC
jgi:hypothetical protein